MDILKQHYEKVVLGALLLGFVLALVYLLQMVQSARNVTLEDLRFSNLNKLYEKQDFTQDEHKIDARLGTAAIWAVRGDVSNLGFHSELSVPMKALRCENTNCGKILPWVVAQTKKVCPHCGEKLTDPQDAPDYESTVAKLDSDADGMPDRYELKMGFNPGDPSDADQDKDGDGFSNLYEFMVKTDPLNSKSLPALEKCLFLVKLQKKVMPVELMGVTPIPDKANPKSKKNWDISIAVNKMRESVAVGGEFEVNKVRYRVLDANYRTGDAQSVSVVLDNDKSEVIIAPVVDGKVDEARKITMVVKQKVYEPNHIAIIRDVREPNARKTIRKSVGEEFAINGEDETKIRFQVIATDAVKESVRLLNMETQEEFMLERHSRIPRNAYVGRGGAGSMDMMGPGMAMPGMDDQQSGRKKVRRPRRN